MAQLIQVVNHEAGVKGGRFVIIELAALLKGRFVMALVIVVVAEYRYLRPKFANQVFHQGCLAAGSTAGNANHQNVIFHFCSSSIRQSQHPPGAR